MSDEEKKSKKQTKKEAAEAAKAAKLAGETEPSPPMPVTKDADGQPPTAEDLAAMQEDTNGDPQDPKNQSTEEIDKLHAEVSASAAKVHEMTEDEFRNEWKYENGADFEFIEEWLTTMRSGAQLGLPDGRIARLVGAPVPETPPETIQSVDIGDKDETVVSTFEKSDEGYKLVSQEMLPNELKVNPDPAGDAETRNQVRHAGGVQPDDPRTGRTKPLRVDPIE